MLMAPTRITCRDGHGLGFAAYHCGIVELETAEPNLPNGREKGIWQPPTAGVPRASEENSLIPALRWLKSLRRVGRPASLQGADLRLGLHEMPTPKATPPPRRPYGALGRTPTAFVRRIASRVEPQFDPGV